MNMNNKFSSEIATKYLNQITQAYLNNEKVYPDQILTFFGVWCFGRDNFEYIIKRFKRNNEMCIKENDTTISNDNLQIVKENLTYLKKIVDKNQKIEKDYVPYYLQKYYHSQNYIFSQIIHSAETNTNIDSHTQMLFLNYLYQTKNNYRTLKEIEQTQKEPSFLERLFNKNKIEIEPIEDAFISADTGYQLQFKPSKQSYSKKNKLIHLASPVCIRTHLNEQDEQTTSNTYTQKENTVVLPNNYIKENNEINNDNYNNTTIVKNENHQAENEYLQDETNNCKQNNLKQNIDENLQNEEDLNA